MDERCNEYYLTLFKSRIINKICGNENAVKLIDPKENDSLEIEDTLRGGEWEIGGKEIKEQGHIFDYNYVDNTTTDSKTFVCVEALPYSFSYPTVDVLLYIHIYVHKDRMRLTSPNAVRPSSPTSTEMAKLGFIGNRCDQLTQVIGKILNGSTDIGGLTEIQPYERGYITVDIPNSSFYGKCMIFKAKIGNVELLGCENN